MTHCSTGMFNRRIWSTFVLDVIVLTIRLFAYKVLPGVATRFKANTYFTSYKNSFLWNFLKLTRRHANTCVINTPGLYKCKTDVKDMLRIGRSSRRSVECRDKQLVLVAYVKEDVIRQLFYLFTLKRWFYCLFITLPANSRLHLNQFTNGINKQTTTTKSWVTEVVDFLTAKSIFFKHFLFCLSYLKLKLDKR